MLQFGLIGRKLGHSFSPDIHRMISAYLDDEHKYEYDLYPMEPEELRSFAENTHLDGFNVTIPYKTDIIPLCAELSPRAKFIGSVNTVKRMPNGTFLGDNTDYFGFDYMLGEYKASLFCKKALVLGSGGASKTVRTVLKDAGIPYVIISRSGENNYNNLHLHADAELIVNTTPVGMYPHTDESPVDLTQFSNCRLVLDIVYNPARTALLLQADELGIPAKNGLSMLVAQAVAAGEIFVGTKLPNDLLQRITDAIDARTRNILLIGMPGCGKTTVATYLSEMTGRKMVDTDEIIVKNAGMSIPEIFSKYGQEHFRKLETEALASVSKESGLIIATGGGVVTQPRNLPLIRQNSRCIFLERPLEQLDVSGRPISQAVGVEKLFKERLPLYQAWSDLYFYNPDSLSTAKKICESLGL
ncbi:MAG: shikimate kinase [Oscillospiraceae bacterium]|nr:shikimate kinase [Oscillospiraceae bacterium]